MNLDFWKSKKVFLTGHTGFKGSWLVRILHLLGSSIDGYALSPSTKFNLFDLLNLNNICSSTIGDINSFDLLDKKLVEADPHIVIHMAAQPLVINSVKDPLSTVNTNILGTANLLESCRKLESCKAILIVTTDKCYQADPKGIPMNETSPLGGNDPYSASKACAEIITHSYRNTYFNSINSPSISTARAGNVIGGGDWSENRLITDIVEHIWNSKPLFLRYPNAVRPWQHVLDSLFGYLTLIQKMYENKIYNGAWNFGPSTMDSFSVKMIVDMFKSTNELTYNYLKPNITETDYLRLDTTKVKNSINWTNKLSTTETVELTRNWYSEFYTNKSAEEITDKQIKFYLKNF